MVEKTIEECWERLKPLINHSDFSYAYFLRKASEKWLPFLEKDEHFKHLHCSTKKSEKDNMVVAGLGMYLVKISDRKPRDVIRIIERVYIDKDVEFRNPWILSLFAEAICNMPTEHSRLMVSKITREDWADMPYVSQVHEYVSKLMLRLAGDGHMEESLKLCKMLLCVRLDNTKGLKHNARYGTGPEVKPVLDQYKYDLVLREYMPSLFQKFPFQVIKLLVESLEDVILLDGKSREDHEAVYEDPRRFEWGFRRTLLETLDKLLIDGDDGSAPIIREELELLGRKTHPVFKRLIIVIYVKFFPQFKKDAELLIVNEFGNKYLRQEYNRLLEKQFPNISDSTKEKYLDLVDAGPNEKSWNHVFVERGSRWWKKDRLKPVLGHLTKDQKIPFKELINEMKKSPTTDYDEGLRIAPEKTDLADGLSTEKVLSFVKSYTFGEKSLDYDEGTAHKFKRYASEKPLEFSTRALDLKNVNVRFAGMLFLGLGEAIRNGRTEIDWDPVLSFCRHIVDYTSDGRYPMVVLDHVTDLLRIGLGKKSIGFRFREKVWRLLETCTTFEVTEGVQPRSQWTLKRPELGTESKEGARVEWTPHNDLSAIYRMPTANLIGKTFDAIIKYAAWCDSHLREDKKPVFVPETKELLTKYFDGKIPNSPYAHVILGIYLLNLVFYDEGWATKNFSRLFSHERKELYRAAWQGYLMGRVYPETFSKLYGNYRDHVLSLPTPGANSGNNIPYTDERLADHITLAYCFGIEKGKESFRMILHYGSNQMLSHCASHIGILLKEQKEDPDESFDLEAIRHVWKDTKLAANEYLWMWLEYSPFGGDETMEMLFNSLKRPYDNINPPFRTVSSLEPYAKSHPSKMVDCLRLLVKLYTNGGIMYHIIGLDLRHILETLLRNGDAEVIKKTRSLVEYLGSVGYDEYGDLMEWNGAGREI